MRKCLGVVAGIAALCALSWAQAQEPASAPTPQSTTSTQQTSSTPLPIDRPSQAPKFPRLELFGGYSFGQMGLFNAGHWAQLNGWNASFALNAASWLGFVAEGSEYFGTSKIPTAAPAPFPTCPPFCPQTSPTFNVNTREYNILFGAQFPYRKYERFTPFGELMFGHGGVRGQAAAQGVNEVEVSSGLALLAGGGVDYKINPRFALRIKADYLQTRTSFPLPLGKAKQDNLRLSVGIVIRNVHKKKRTLEEETPPEQ